MFDSQKEFLVKIVSGGVKQVPCRFPTDAEWCDRSRKQRTIQHLLGRGKTRSEAVGVEDADAELLEKIRTDRSEEFDKYEASAFISKLERCTIVSAECVGNQYKITTKVPGGETVHLLSTPTKAQEFEYGRASVHVTGGRRLQEIRTTLEPSGQLYDRLAVSTDGYLGSIPIIHKDVVIVELLSQVQTLIDEDEDDPEI